jgi:hypothetical protein
MVDYPTGYDGVVFYGLFPDKQMEEGLYVLLRR